VERYAAFLGINPVVERGLMWLAEEGLYAPLPPGWRELQDLHGTLTKAPHPALPKGGAIACKCEG